VAEVRRMNAAGRSPTEIAEELEISRMSVYRAPVALSHDASPNPLPNIPRVPFPEPPAIFYLRFITALSAAAYHHLPKVERTTLAGPVLRCLIQMPCCLGNFLRLL
jgi:hypothetical protein